MADWQGQRVTYNVHDEYLALRAQAQEQARERAREQARAQALAQLMERLPPRFADVEEAERWLAERDEPRQLYATGSYVRYWRQVDVWELPTGIIVTNSNVEWTGRVLSWSPVWRLASGDMRRPVYRVLTVAPHTDDPEIDMVFADNMLGLADG